MFLFLLICFINNSLLFIYTFLISLSWSIVSLWLLFEISIFSLDLSKFVIILHEFAPLFIQFPRFFYNFYCNLPHLLRHSNVSSLKIIVNCFKHAFFYPIKTLTLFLFKILPEYFQFVFVKLTKYNLISSD